MHIDIHTKYQRISLTKEIKDLWNENLKILKKQIEEDTRKLERLLYLRICRINKKMAMLLKAIYNSIQSYCIQYNPHQISNYMLNITKKNCLKIHVEIQMIMNSLSKHN